MIDLSHVFDLRLIVAVGKSGQLGLGNEIPWSDVRDLKFFKEATANGVVVVGHRTWPQVADLDGTNGRTFLLHGENRRVDGKNYEWSFHLPFRVARPDQTIWIAGGLSTYRKWIEFAKERDLFMPWVISPINYEGEADCFMDMPWEARS